MGQMFICYSLRLMKFLKSEGFEYGCVGLNPDNKRTFWAYVRNEQLNYALDKWNSVKCN